jgi:hypothetical protein
VHRELLLKSLHILLPALGLARDGEHLHNYDHLSLLQKAPLIKELFLMVPEFTLGSLDSLLISLG